MIDVLIIVAVLGYSGWIGIRFWRKSRQGACSGCSSSGACSGCNPAPSAPDGADSTRSDTVQ